MISILQFLRLFPNCPVCQAPTGFDPKGRSGAYSCQNIDCLKFCFSVARLYKDLPETILEIQLGEARYKYLFSSQLLMYFNVVNPKGHGESLAVRLSENKALALFRTPSKLIEKYPIRGAFLSFSSTREQLEVIAGWTDDYLNVYDPRIEERI